MKFASHTGLIYLLFWFYSRGGRYRPIYYLGFTVEMGNSSRFIILVLQQRWTIPTDLLSWLDSRGGRYRSIYYLGFTVEVGDSGRFIILVFTVEVGDTDRFIILVFTVEVDDTDRFIFLVLQQRWAITTDLLSWFYSRGGQ